MPDYVVMAETTHTFGRVLLGARSNHVVVDGPAQNGCPGEAGTPAELFLGGVVSCAAGLVQVVARNDGVGPTSVRAGIEGTGDRAHAVRAGVTGFSAGSLGVGVEGRT